ncbi:glycosyltransferase [Cronbergia sp. UHCC 0137]|uniref:glycosyltransferase n=1 Tax=Cronbergia sp. UHCC 0137 TaxID=3110239 RepID=UPI002B1EC355|nr:glycosyltransferase [Cronbergia sp. UHCC 0137]MEA5620678.1 glycosyltransferase [Cronbergia sp. UHCC 0137]
MQALISVIICTHNPRSDYLKRVLQALKDQTLSLEHWELLLIDNASDKLLASEIDLSWHPNSRHIREDELGLTPARLRGIKEAIGEILVFVDDDNILDLDYLEVSLRISKDYPFVGAWGGQIRPEFEIEPPDWTKPYWNFLAIRQFDCDQWSNSQEQNTTTPCGAGLCIRRFVAQKYSHILHQDPKRMDLDRKGKSLVSCGDTDLALTSCDLGLGTGVFTSLRLTHLMPSQRLQEDYLLNLLQGVSYSVTILNALRGKLPIYPCRSQRIFQKYMRWRMDLRSQRFYDAEQLGKQKAMKEIASWRKVENL